jgi:hypothetical protein
MQMPSRVLRTWRSSMRTWARYPWMCTRSRTSSSWLARRMKKLSAGWIS